MANEETRIPQRSEFILCELYLYAYDCLLPVSDRPDDKHLNRYVREKVCAAGTNKWRDLGIALMGQDAVPSLGVIRTNYPNDVEECCSRMFTKWHQRTPKASWKQLIEALKEVKLIQLASELEELLIPSVELEGTTIVCTCVSVLHRQHSYIIIVCRVCKLNVIYDC